MICDKNISASVVALGSPVCPTAIIRAISLIVVNAVNRQSVLIPVSNSPLPKLQKIGSPFLSYFYTSGTISFKVAVSLRIASRLHVAPYTIKAIPIPEPVCFCSLRLLFRREATARNR